MQREHHHLQSTEQFPCPETTRLNKAVAAKFMPVARSNATWAVRQAWLSKFYAFAQDICKKSGKVRSNSQCLASALMCRHFIAHVAEQKRGHTRPRSARMVLSAERQKRGWVSLSSDQTISMVVAGAEAEAPRTKKQSAGLTMQMLKFIVKGWGTSAQSVVGRCVAWQISFKAVGLTFDLSLVTERLPCASTMSDLLP